MYTLAEDIIQYQAHQATDKLLKQIYWISWPACLINMAKNVLQKFYEQTDIKKCQIEVHRIKDL